MQILWSSSTKQQHILSPCRLLDLPPIIDDDHLGILRTYFLLALHSIISDQSFQWRHAGLYTHTQHTHTIRLEGRLRAHQHTFQSASFYCLWSSPIWRSGNPSWTCHIRHLPHRSRILLPCDIRTIRSTDPRHANWQAVEYRNKDFYDQSTT